MTTDTLNKFRHKFKGSLFLDGDWFELEPVDGDVGPLEFQIVEIKKWETAENVWNLFAHALTGQPVADDCCEGKEATPITIMSQVADDFELFKAPPDERADK